MSLFEIPIIDISAFTDDSLEFGKEQKLLTALKIGEACKNVGKEISLEFFRPLNYILQVSSLLLDMA